MKLELIRSFAMLGETRHFGDAARRLGISQPSLTKQIRRLEDLLGGELFARDRQGTELTALGRQFLVESQPLLRAADQVWERGLRAARGEAGHLAIGFNFSGVDLMARILARFQARYPDITLSFDDISSDDQARGIAEGRLDVGFARIPAPGDLAQRRIGSDRLVLVFPATLPPDQALLSQSGVGCLPFVGLQEHVAPGLERLIQGVLADHALTPRVTHRVNGPLTVLALVSAGFGFALMHESSLRGLAGQVGGIATRPLDEPAARWDVGLIWRPAEQHPTVLRFLHVAAETLGDGAWSLPSLRPRRTAEA